MKSFRERATEGLQIGDTFITSRVFTNDDVLLFAQISRDYNPVHFDTPLVKLRNFSTPICHGLLVASLATEIGGQIAWLASAMNFRFKAPVYVEEKVICRWVITAIDENGRAQASITITKEDGSVVVEAEISGIIPGLEERKALKQMLLEGDLTNKVPDRHQHQMLKVEE